MNSEDGFFGNVWVKEISSTQKRLRIEIPERVVVEKMECIYKKLERTACVDGFRPGKVPREILEKRYRDDVEEKAIRNLIDSTYLRTIEAAHLEPVSPVEVENIEFSPGHPLRYSLLVEIEPVEPSYIFYSEGGGEDKLAMRKVKSRKEYTCDDCHGAIKRGESYYHLDMSPQRYRQMTEGGEEIPIIKRACVECVAQLEKKIIENTVSATEKAAEKASEVEKEQEIYRMLEKGISDHQEARA